MKKFVQLGCITQGSLAEITNQRFSLKYQTFRQLAAAFITDKGSSKRTLDGGDCWMIQQLNGLLVLS